MSQRDAGQSRSPAPLSRTDQDRPGAWLPRPTPGRGLEAARPSPAGSAGHCCAHCRDSTAGRSPRPETGCLAPWPGSHRTSRVLQSRGSDDPPQTSRAESLASPASSPPVTTTADNTGARLGIHFSAGLLASRPGLPSNYQRLGNRSPQIRALAIPAHLPDLPLCLLMAWTSWFNAHSSRLTASYRVRVPQVAVLPPASSGPRLAATPLPLATVGTINPREGLPPS